MMKLLYEMETSDPDDFLTLLWLLDHPAVQLVGVCVTPGSRTQCAAVRWAAQKCGRPDLPIGAHNIDHPKECVSAWHFKTFGDALRRTDPGHIPNGPNLIGAMIAKHPDLTVLTGSPPKNLGGASALDDFKLARWVCQGGFAGDPVVPPEHRLAKFAGKTTCATFNLGGAPRTAVALVAAETIARRVFVSKNVCHGVKWSRAMAEAIKTRFGSPVRQGAYLMMQGADAYLAEHEGGKAVHDLLAAAVAVDESVCTLVEVDLFRKHGEWGSVPKANTRSWISVAYNEERFYDVLTAMI